MCYQDIRYEKGNERVLHRKLAAPYLSSHLKPNLNPVTREPSIQGLATPARFNLINVQ